MQEANAENGERIVFSRWWLYFDSPNEKDFQTHLNARRAQGILDPILFAFFAILSLAGIPRLFRKGHEEEMPLLVLSSLFGFLVVALYRRPQHAGLVRSNRIFLHMIMHLLSHLQNLRMLALPEMVSCPDSRPKLEFLVLWWIFQALFPAVASIPLAYAFPMQLLTTATTFSNLKPLCDIAFTHCAGAARLYTRLAAAFTVVSLMIPSPPGIINIKEIDPAAACYGCLILISIAVSLLLFYMVIYQVESRLRANYCTEKRYFWSAEELNTCRTTFGLLALWMFLFLCFAWRTIEFFLFRRDDTPIHGLLVKFHPAAAAKI